MQYNKLIVINVSPMEIILLFYLEETNAQIYLLPESFYCNKKIQRLIQN